MKTTIFLTPTNSGNQKGYKCLSDSKFDFVRTMLDFNYSILLSRVQDGKQFFSPDQCMSNSASEGLVYCFLL